MQFLLQRSVSGEGEARTACVKVDICSIKGTSNIYQQCNPKYFILHSFREDTQHKEMHVCVCVCIVRHLLIIRI